jgi:hypothetical protein
VFGRAWPGSQTSAARTRLFFKTDASPCILEAPEVGAGARPRRQGRTATRRRHAILRRAVIAVADIFPRGPVRRERAGLRSRGRRQCHARA